MEKKEINPNSLSGNYISSTGASLLFQTIEHLSVSSLKQIILSHNELNDDCMASLGELIQNNSSIEKIVLTGGSYGRGNIISDKGIEILSFHLHGNLVLKMIDLTENRGITDASIPFLIDAVKASCICDVNVWDTSVSDIKSKELKEYLDIPIDKRCLPVQSSSKSAAKMSNGNSNS